MRACLLTAAIHRKSLPAAVSERKGLRGKRADDIIYGLAEVPMNKVGSSEFVRYQLVRTILKLSYDL